MAQQNHQRDGELLVCREGNPSCAKPKFIRERSDIAICCRRDSDDGLPPSSEIVLPGQGSPPRFPSALRVSLTVSVSRFLLFFQYLIFMWLREACRRTICRLSVVATARTQGAGGSERLSPFEVACVSSLELTYLLPRRIILLGVRNNSSKNG